jgi:ATP-dependent protease ClpP protease subunit
MAKVRFYTSFFSFTVEMFMREFDEAEATGEDIELQVYSGGGDVLAGMGMIRTLMQSERNVSIQIDGAAYSMAAFFPMFVKGKKRALNGSRFLFHRGASRMEDNPGVLTTLQEINDMIKAKFKEVINVAVFERLAGTTVDRFFDSTQPRIDFEFNAQQAKEMGLINEIFNLNTGEIEALRLDIAASHQVQLPEVFSNNQNSRMTLSEFQAQHPEIYNQVYQSGVDAGTESERTRVLAFMEFSDVALDDVKAGIEGGKPMNDLHRSKFMKASLQAMANLEADDQGDEGGDQGGDQGDGRSEGNDQGQGPLNAGDADMEAANASIRAKLGINARALKDFEAIPHVK